MSLILDALRKAEASRQGTPAQALAVPHPQARRRRVGPGWVLPATIAATALLVVALWLYRSTSPGGVSEAIAAPVMPPPATSAPAAAPRTAGVPPASPAPAATSRPGVRRLALETAPTTPAPRVEIPAATATARPASGKRLKPGTVEVRDLLGDAPGTKQSTASGSGALPTAGTVRVADASSSNAHSQPAERNLMTMDQLILSGKLNSAPLRMDMHSYAEKPADRFVYLNMRRYREGDTTAEDVIVDEITPDGAVLRLGRQQFVIRSK